MKTPKKPRMGRPPLPENERRRNIGIMLEPAVIEMIAEIALQTGETRNGVVNTSVRRYHRTIAKKFTSDA